jgi:cytochrome b subunit of formate dehydrogenase
MLRMLILLGLLVAIALPLIDAAVFRPRRRTLPGGSLRAGERLMYLVFVIAMALMAISSLGVLLIGGHMTRWMLILHMSVAPLFAIVLTALALLWAEQHSMEREAAGGAERFDAGEKFTFWLVVLAGLTTIATAMLLMMSWFGSDAQQTLLNVHRYGSLVLLILTVYQAYRLLAGRPSTVSA